MLKKVKEMKMKMIRVYRIIKDWLFGTCASCEFSTTKNCSGETAFNYVRCKKQPCCHCDCYKLVDIAGKCKEYKRRNK